MDYTLEEIYLLVGREDKTASVWFKYGSESYAIYGSYVTVLFEYTQKERESLDRLVTKEPFEGKGYIKARFLGMDINQELIDRIKKEGINSEDISSIQYFIHPRANTFHSKETREIKTLNIQTESRPKGGDLGWMYGFKKKLLRDGVGLTPYERSFYLAGKFYFEPDSLTDSEKAEAFQVSGTLNEAVEWEYLQMRYHRDEITPEQMTRLGILLKKSKKLAFDKLNHYLTEAGSSMGRLWKANPEKAAELYAKVHHYNDRRIGIGGKKPIYLDIDGYLHIYMRHAEEMKVNAHFEHKDNFQWKEADILTVMKHVIAQVNAEVQAYFEANPQGRYSRYGNQSLYFEGDYYTFHIENDGRISTFHKNKKAIQ